MQIRPNRLLTPTEKSIKPWERSFISVEGPNNIDELLLNDIAIGYSDFYLSRQVLFSNTKNIPLQFNGLEEELIFLMVRVRKDSEDNPHLDYDITRNITYYFSGFTGDTQAINTFFIQTGSYENKVPRIFFNNPNEFNVVLDVFGAILEKTTTSISNTGVTVCSNLWLESVISDQVPDNISSITGSTALKTILFNIDGYVDDDYVDDYFEDDICSTIPYTGITNIVKDLDNLRITITGDTQVYILNFLTEFDLHQAYSRIKWVMSDPDNRFLDVDYVYESNSGITGIDTQVPIIYYYPSGTTTPTGSTLGVLTKNQVLEHFISGVTDYWDNNLDITGATSYLTKLGSPVTLTGTSEEGIYEIEYTYTDNANNFTGATIGNILVDATLPIIHYKYGIVSSGTTGSTLTGSTIDYSGSTITEVVEIFSGFTMVASGRTPTGITSNDIMNYIIDSVYDNVDTTISKYDIDFYKVDNRRNLIDVIADPYYTKTYNSLTIPPLSGAGQTLIFTGGTNLYWTSGDTANIRYNSTHNFNVIVDNYNYTTGIFSTTITSGITGSGSTYSNWIVDEQSGNKILDFCIKLTLSDFCGNITTDYLILRTKS